MSWNRRTPRNRVSLIVIFPSRSVCIAGLPAGTHQNSELIGWQWPGLPLRRGGVRAEQPSLKPLPVVVKPPRDGSSVGISKVTEPGQRGSLSSLLEAGLRAVTIRVDDVRGVAGFILPGDYVDVVLIAEVGAARRENYSEILLQHLKVLAVDQLVSERQEQPTVAKAVTLEVTQEQAQKVLLATNIGKLSLILRRPAEATTDPTRRVTERDLGDEVVRNVEPVRPPPPNPVAARVEPSNTVKVVVVRNLKREEYTVMRSDK